MIYTKTHILLTVIITFSFCVLSAQTNVIEHIVSKGDNVYRLSLRYQTTMDAIFKLNPSSKTSIIVGETLRIPNNRSLLTEQNLTSKTHLVAKGETKYGLSKKYNVSIAQLEEANPHIKKMLVVGHVIKIPSNNTDEQIVKNSTTHTVKKGETLWSISQKHGIPLNELQALNYDRIKDFIKTGQVLVLNKNPKENKINTNTYSINTEDTTTKIQPIEKNKISEKTELTNNSSPAPTLKTDTNNVNETNNTHFSPINLAVLWNEDLNTDNTTSKNDNAKYLEGLKLAIDSINKEYPQYEDLNIIKTTGGNLLLNSTPKAALTSTHLYPLDNLDSNNKTENIDLFSIAFNNKDGLKKIYLKSLPTDDDMRDRVLDYLKNKNGQVICIYDTKNTKNTNIIKTTLPNVNFIETDKTGAFASDSLTNALSTKKKNYIIIESSNTGVFLNCTNILFKKMSSYNIQLVVLNPKNIPSSKNITSNRFKVLHLLYPKQHSLTSNKEMDEVAALSFAVNYDAIKRIYKINKLEAFTNNKVTTVSGTPFKYVLSGDIFVNKAVPLYMFDENSDATLVSKY